MLVYRAGHAGVECHPSDVGSCMYKGAILLHRISKGMLELFNICHNSIYQGFIYPGSTVKGTSLQHLGVGLRSTAPKSILCHAEK